MTKDLESALKRIDKLEQLREEDANERKRLKRRNYALAKELMTEQEAIKALQAIEHTVIAPPKWLHTPSTRQHEATPVQMFSDWHLGEVQPSIEVGNYNAYSDKIAEMRMFNVANSSIKVIKEYTAGLIFPGIVLPFAGDTITGEIHSELTNTNAESIIETIVRWVPKIAAMIEMYANEFEHVYIPAVMGNHSRRGAQMKHKNQARDSYDWLIMKWLAHYFKNEDQIEIQASDALELRFKIYNTRFLLTHGYFGGGAGSSSLGRVVATKQKMVNRDRVTGNDFDYLLMGHYHTHVMGPGVIQCGCLKGLDSYAADINCVPEPPSQALFFVTPERSVTMQTPIFAEAPGERKLWSKVQYYRNV